MENWKLDWIFMLIITVGNACQRKFSRTQVSEYGQSVCLLFLACVWRVWCVCLFILHVFTPHVQSSALTPAPPLLTPHNNYTYTSTHTPTHTHTHTPPPTHTHTPPPTHTHTNRWIRTSQAHPRRKRMGQIRR